jgi:hypothetical protein
VTVPALGDSGSGTCVPPVDPRLAVRAERHGKVAIVLDVPVEESPPCGDRWIAWSVAHRLDELVATMLTGDVEVATRHFDVSNLSAV